MLKILCAIQSRLDSSRLPRKAMLPLGERAMYFQVYHRIHEETWFQDDTDALLPSIHIDTKMVVPSDDLVEYVADSKQYTNNMKFYGGSRENVYDRFVHASVDYDWIVRITADCPLVCPDVIQEMVVEFAALREEGVDYYSNDTVVSGYPDGLDVEIFTRDALLRYPPENPADEEHVTLAIKRHSILRTKFEDNARRVWPQGVKLSVDTKDEYELVKKFFESPDGPPLTVPALYDSVRRASYEYGEEQ